MLFSITGRRLGAVLPRSVAVAHRVERAAAATRAIATVPGAATVTSGFRVPELTIRLARSFATRQVAATKPKKKTAAKKTTKTAAAKKPKARRVTKKPKRELTEKEKNLARVRELKPVALKAPKQLPATAYLLLASQVSGNLVKTQGIKAAAQQVSQQYKALSPSEREQLNHTAQQNKAKNDEAYKQWVRSIPAIDVYRANLARRQLTRRGVKGYSRKIVDDRQVKRPLTPMTLFVKERHASGDMAGIKPSEALKLISGEWKALPQSEKQKYTASSLQDLDRYKAEYQRLFGKAYASRAKRPSA